MYYIFRWFCNRPFDINSFIDVILSTKCKNYNMPSICPVYSLYKYVMHGFKTGAIHVVGFSLVFRWVFLLIALLFPYFILVLRHTGVVLNIWFGVSVSLVLCCISRWVFFFILALIHDLQNNLKRLIIKGFHSFSLDNVTS